MRLFTIGGLALAVLPTDLVAARGAEPAAPTEAQLEAAKKLYAKLGAHHRDTLTTVYHLAVAYYRSEMVPQATDLLERVRDLQVKVLGADHPRTLTTLAGLAVAYEANPLVRWMFADDLSSPRLTSLFSALVRVGIGEGQVYRTVDGDGAAIWFPPRESTSGPDVAGHTSEWSSRRRAAALGVLAAARPAERHFYLDAVGVVPTRSRCHLHRIGEETEI